MKEVAASVDEDKRMSSPPLAKFLHFGRWPGRDRGGSTADEGG